MIKVKWLANLLKCVILDPDSFHLDAPPSSTNGFQSHHDHLHPGNRRGKHWVSYVGGLKLSGSRILLSAILNSVVCNSIT